MGENLKTVKEGQVAWLVLNRPEKRNSMTDEFFTELGESFRAFDADPEVRAVVVRAEGKGFTAGLYGNFGQTNYSAAKMALIGFMNTLKLEGAKYDIKVNTVAPVAASRLMADVIPPDILEKMPQAFRADKAAGVNVVFQYTISGEGGGEWFAEIKEGACRVEAGKHAGPTCTLAIASADFLALMNGKLPAMEAYTSGKLKIGGDIMKSQLIGKLFKM